ncbi:MAG: alpha/beta fold hydrolase, partial [Pseudomonadota bacterium]
MTWTTQPRSKLADLAAVVVGDGPNHLFIHGVGLRAEAWNAQIARFAPQHRVIAVDMPGHGGSPALQTRPSLPAYTDMIAAVLAEPAVVIGHSMGAMIALD